MRVVVGVNEEPHDPMLLLITQDVMSDDGWTNYTKWPNTIPYTVNVRTNRKKDNGRKLKGNITCEK